MIMSETQEQQIRKLGNKNIKWNGENGRKMDRENLLWEFPPVDQGRLCAWLVLTS